MQTNSQSNTPPMLIPLTDVTPKQTSLPLKSLKINPNNPRTDASAQVNSSKLDSMARSLLRLGVMQPLTVNQEVDGGYTIISGERRFLALMRNVEQQKVRPDGSLCTLEDPIPVVLYQNLSASRIMEMAITENQQRLDVNAADKLLYFKRLRDSGSSEAEIADIYGMQPITVERWLYIGDHATEEVLDHLRHGRLNMSQAYVILSASPTNQATLLKLAVEQKYDHVQLTKVFASREIPVSVAIFDVQKYPKALPIPMFDSTPAIFPDVNAFFTLQIEAAKEKARALEERFAWVEVVVNKELDRAHFQTRPCPNAETPDSELGAFVWVNSVTGVVDCVLREQKVTSEPAKTTKSSSTLLPASPVKPTEAPEVPGGTGDEKLSESTVNYPFMVRSNWLQGILKTNLRELQVWMLLGLAGSDHVRLRQRDQTMRAMQETDHWVQSGEAIKEILGGVPLKEADFQKGLLQLNTASGNREHAELELYEALCDLDEVNFNRLFSEVFAALVFDHAVLGASGHHSSLVMLRVFEKYGLKTQTYYELTEDYLKTYQKKGLLKLAKDLPVNTLLKASMNRDQMVQALLKVSGDLRKVGWMPEHFRL